MAGGTCHIRNLLIDGQRVDLFIEDGVIAAIGHRLPASGGAVFDGEAAMAIPGLHDHHIHLRAAAAALLSLKCGPPSVSDGAALTGALLAAPGSGWIRGTGYHESVAGEIDRHWLDRNGPDRPIRIQHRSGRMWILNSRACALVKGAPDDGRWLDGDEELRRQLPLLPQDFGPLVGLLLSWGITGVTDATPRNDDAEALLLAEAIAPLRLVAMGGDARTGAPLKIHEHDHALPSLDALTGRMADAHAAGRAVAIHCVTLAELMLALAAWDAVGARAGDRIEHGAIIPEHALLRIRGHGLAVVTQPLFPHVRRETYARDVDPRDQPDLWRLRSLLDSGICVAAGSDAPFESANPWAAIDAATRLGPEAVMRDQALNLFLRDPLDLTRTRKLAPGEPADLVLLDESAAIRATFIGGNLAHGDPLPRITPS